ncbi:ROK family transcriptional regulator [Streptomyces beijiangensis]|uniref:ROK family protein n=1 Tax=Streptomyces beijiangensis TaxID=163361 RepID=A0A939F6R6_9ACTN|nr:ROK family protein [Streptomyces beijiangensis]MBO0511440.1 ROK family protein [Streptomyces beijiangensis]
MDHKRPLSGDPSLLRRLNTAAALGVLREHEELTAPELATLIGVSRPTAHDVLLQLLGQDRVVELGSESEVPRTGAGRPARRFRFHAEAGHVVGVDIGAHKVLVHVADLRGRTVAVHRVTVTPALTAARRLRVVRDAVAACLAAAPGARPLALGIGTTGIVDPSGCVTLSTALPGWSGLDLTRELDGCVPGPVLVGNDIQLATLAEFSGGAAAGVRDGIYLYVGNRPGIGLWLRGQLHRGHHAAAGELLPFKPWADAYQRLMDWSAGHQGAEAPTRDSAVRAVVTAADAGDGGARYALRAFAEGLAGCLLTHVAALDPELVVLGGGVSRAGGVLREPLAEHLDANCRRPPEVRTSTLGEESTVTGAVRMALEYLEQTAHA